MTKIYSTFSFPVFLTGDAEKEFEVVDANVKGSVIIENGEVVKGQNVCDNIFNQANKIHLVSKTVFDFFDKPNNLCMFDPTKKIIESDKTLYGGFIFSS